MSRRLDDYAAGVLRGMAEGAGDVTRSVIADVGNAYQAFLMADATARPSPGLTGTMEITRYERERDYGPGALEADPAPAFTPPDKGMPGIDIDMER